MKSMKKLVLVAFVLLASVMTLAGCKNDSVPETPKYTVTFDTDGGSAVDSQSVESGKMVTKPEDPSLEGSWFLGWYGDKELTKEFDFTSPITNNTKVYAKWSYKFHAKPKILTGYTSPNNTDDTWTYVAFGDWPQTIKAASVEVTEDESKKKEMGMFTAYLGSDGNYYVKAAEKAYGTGAEYKYSDETQAGQGGTNEKWFKVEPIVWRVLNKDYSDTGKALLLAEKILTGGIPYYVSRDERTIGNATVYPNNYKYSTIRAWLNGSYETEDTQETNYEGKGFLQTAFTEEAQKLIESTKVDNSARSTNPNSDASQWNSGENQFACENTSDKIFLLSEQEATTAGYGFDVYDAFGEGNTRIRVTTDYALATGAYQDSTDGYGGWWWLRSPLYSNENYARLIYIGGDACHDFRRKNLRQFE